MGEISKAVGQWIVANVGWSVIIFLFVLSGLFKIVKIEINPIGWIVGVIGKSLTKDVRNDISKWQTDVNQKFAEIKIDRAAKIDELKTDYNDKIVSLKSDIDAFEDKTNQSIAEIQNGTTTNCNMLKLRLDQMEKSNDMQTIRQIKTHVLNFANSCMNGTKHTIKDFKNIIRENKDYEVLVKKYNLRNDVYKDDFEYIMEIYHNCKQNRSFLMDKGEPIEEDEDDLDVE